MIFTYNDDQVIQVFEPAIDEPTPSVALRVVSKSNELDASRILLLTFRLQPDPSTFQTFGFRIRSRRGLENLVSEIAMELRDLLQPDTAGNHLSSNQAASQLQNAIGDPQAIDASAIKIIDGFEPSHSIEIEWDRQRRLEIVVLAREIRAGRESLGLGYATGIPLLFSSANAAYQFILAFYTEVKRLLRDMGKEF